MLHFLTGTYFVLLMAGALTVIVGMLLANRDEIMEALGLSEAVDLPMLPAPAERRRSEPRVIRLASSASALRLAA